jgi:TonB family protein
VLPESSGRTPTRGAEVRAGNAVAQTGGTGIGFGLSTGGGGTGGDIDIGDFCCPDYLQTMLQIIQRNWNSKQQVAGVSAVRFTIARDGTTRDVSVAKPSGYAMLDLTAQRAVAMSRMPPLPGAYTNPTLTITLTFEYQR